MKKILFLFLAACFFFSCEKETIVIPQQHAGRTVLAFFWADNSLNSSLRNNIQTMMQGLQAMKDSAALLVYWDGEASDISWPEPCIVEYVTNGQGGINSLSKGTIDAMMADKNTSIYDLIGIGNIRKKYPPQIGKLWNNLWISRFGMVAHYYRHPFYRTRWRAVFQ